MGLLQLAHSVLTFSDPLAFLQQLISYEQSCKWLDQIRTLLVRLQLCSQPVDK